ncbi:TonB-dependent receptor domain-containing protein [Pseudoduganella flava]|uniref:TonB-dependent receptor domain-containing protein n=1 Tax=Pseudoduganella flava TaxID=871742 RepID=UPI001E4984D5|nr:TonB-dependent receptor [Pseudoduganella flava]
MLSRSIRMICASGVALGMQAAHAQEAQPADTQLQKVEVTGSRIPSANLTGASPITVINAAEIKMDGVRSVENLLNNMPQVFADQGATISNGSSGTATVNLRNFGPDRTLVLINGRRLPSGSPSNTAADLNQIPAALIKNIELLTGGASAVYGSDAVAGVVNFIMNDSFQGVQLELNHSFYNHQQNGGPAAAAVRDRNYALPGDKGADGKIKDASLLIGSNFADQKGNATVFFGYKKEDALLQSERDFSACSLGGFTNGSQLRCGGSGTSFPGRFITANGGFTVADANGNVRPYVAATDQYNFGPLNYFQRPSERYTFAAFTHYNINDNATVYAEANFHDDHTVAQIAPSGLFGFDASGANAIHNENPFLTPAWKTALGLNADNPTAEALIFRRNVEGGGRQDDIRHTSYRGVLGMRGEWNNWHYDAFVQLGKVIYAENYLNDFSIARTARALDVVTDANGKPVCRVALQGIDTACAPYNIWALGGVSQEALNYLQTPGFKKGSTHQTVQGINVGTDLGNYGIKVPGANDGVNVSLGWEHRTEKLELRTDAAFDTGDLAGQGGPTHGVEGQFSVREYFTEVAIPLLQKRPFAEDLLARLTYRRSDYSTGNKTNSYGLGLEWAPTSTVKVRGSYQRAVRAANIVEMYTPRGIGLYDNDEDPCAGATPTASLEQCARTGVTAAQYGHIEDSPAQQYNGLFGGNKDLKPETSDSYTFGIVLQPMRNLSLTVDYFNLKVEDVILDLPATTTLTQCLETGDPKFCSLITRDRTGSLWALPTAQIVATKMNLGSRKTSGIDISANYKYKTPGYGDVAFALTGTWLKEFKQEDVPGTGEYDCAGYFGPSCGTPLPKWRHKFRTTWSTPWNVDMALTWRFIDKVDLSSTSSDPNLAGASEEADRVFGRRNYFDLTANWQATKAISLRVGVNNLFDKDPPVGGITSSTFGNGNTFPQVYDALGRRVFMNLTARF